MKLPSNHRRWYLYITIYLDIKKDLKNKKNYQESYSSISKTEWSLQCCKNVTFITKWIFAWIERVYWMFWFNNQCQKTDYLKKKKKKDLRVAKMSAVNINTAHCSFTLNMGKRVFFFFYTSKILIISKVNHIIIHCIKGL